jgi:hypothetical protein
MGKGLILMTFQTVLSHANGVMRGMTIQTIVVKSLLMKSKIIYLMTLGTISMLLLNMRIMTNITLSIGMSTIRKRHINRFNFVTF